MAVSELGHLVRWHRKTAGLTRVELAMLAGVGKTVIFDIEHGKLSIRFDTLCRVLDTLNLQLNLTNPLLQSRGVTSVCLRAFDRVEQVEDVSE